MIYVLLDLIVCVLLFLNKVPSQLMGDSTASCIVWCWVFLLMI